MTRSVPRLIAALSLASLTLQAPSATSAKERRDDTQEDELDLLSLGARLIADGHYDRAAAVLEQLDPSDEEIDRAKLHFLRGTIYLKKELYAQARDELVRSVHAGQQNPAIHVFLAQAYFQLDDHRNVLASLDRAPTLAEENAGTFLLRAESHWKLTQRAQAFSVLDRGIARFPSFPKLFQAKVAYLIELALYQEVVRIGEPYLARAEVQPIDFVAIAEGLRRAKQLNEARLILERARLRFPDDVEVAAQLANTYNDLERPLTAAMLYESAARSEGKYSFEAAELYKQAGRLARALSLNARILEPSKKLKQRLAILLEMERYEMVAGMEPSLSRAGLIKDENIRYALAYGYFKNGDFDSAEQHLKQLSSAAIFEKAAALRKAMATCREAGWACY